MQIEQRRKRLDETTAPLHRCDPQPLHLAIDGLGLCHEGDALPLCAVPRQ
ncbi:hypothetical protein SESBI_37780 [Sesbania bispinosa]|nr:hypothetical protein SESBI_37780 [Sesbania bispinosa]